MGRPAQNPYDTGDETAEQPAEENQARRPVEGEFTDAVFALRDTAHGVWMEKARGQHHQPPAHSQDQDSG